MISRHACGTARSIPSGRAFRKLITAAGLLALVLTGGCAGKSPSGPPPTVGLAMDGPPLAVVGEYAGMRLEGTLERKGMAGFGTMELHSTGPASQTPMPGQQTAFTCSADFKDPPTEKGRVRGVLSCNGNRAFALSLRNLGPDQGVGIGRENDQGDLMVLFYHSSAEEAERRFPSVQEDIRTARQMRR